MKNKKNILILFLLFVISFNTVSYGEARSDVLNIVFTHDLHDHFEDFDVLEDGEIVNTGGFNRLNTKIKEEREKDKDLLVLDGGDYSMGTLFQTIYSEESPSLRLLGEIGYDATTLGNHEFDFKARGLIDSLNSAKKSKDKLPEIVSSNIDFKNYDDVDREEVKELEKAFENYGGKEYIVIDKKGIKIGIFGILGDEAISNAPMAGVNFKDPSKSAKLVTKKLKEDEKVDIVICLSHSGTSENSKKSEDEILAKKVPDIDLIISGHTHTKLEEPIVVGNTIIASSGRYTENIGILKLVGDGERWTLEEYRVEPLTDKDYDRDLDEKIRGFKKDVQKNYLDKFDLKYNQVLAHTSYNFTSAKDIGKEHREDTLANLISDSFIYMVKKIEGDDYKRVYASIVPAGTIRDSFTKGDISVSHVFNANSLGIGPDNISGYPLVEVYLTGADLKTAAEVDASIAPIMGEAQLYMSGVGYTFNPHRLIFNKLTDVHLIDEDGTREEIVDDELYRIVAGLYTGQMLSIVKDQSFGLLSIIPRNEDGIEIEKLEDHIIYNGENETKEWFAVSEYISSFDKKFGKSEIPKKYKEVDGRKNIDNRKSLKNILMKPNKLAKTFYAAIILFLAIIAIIISIIFKKRKSKKIE